MDVTRFVTWFSGFLLATALWQLEVIYIGITAGWGYRPLFFLNYTAHGETWLFRDLWMTVIIVTFLMLLFILKKRELNAEELLRKYEEAKTKKPSLTFPDFIDDIEM